VLAEAVQELFPGTQVTIGPAIEDGFYYDFARDEPFSLDDLATIEKRMREIVDRDEKITPRGSGPRRGHRRLREHGRELQGPDHP
jgi:threonyl-tRNA synthetase